MIKRIFLDLDGVLCSFVDAVAELFETTEEELYKKWVPGEYDVCVPLGITTKQLWEKVTEAGREHWANLKPFPWTKELWELCNDHAPTVILTSPSRDPNCLAGKSEWMNEYLGGGKTFRKFLIGPIKEFCAAEGHLLIDDSEENCKKFREGGGRAICFPQIWNSGFDSCVDRIGVVKRWLEQYAS